MAMMNEMEYRTIGSALAGGYRAAVYCRLSKDDDLQGESASIANQRDMLEKYCEKQGWEVVAVYQDDGFTGLNMERPDLQRMAGRERGDVQSPGNGFEKLARVLGPGRVRLLSYRTVGLSDGLLLALRPDRVEINGRKHPGMLVAASAHPVSDGGEYQGLVGPEEIGGIV